MAPIDPRDFGRLEAEVQAMQAQMEEMAADLKAVRSLLDNAAGGWRVMMAVAGLTSAITAIVIKILPLWPIK